MDFYGSMVQALKRFLPSRDHEAEDIPKWEVVDLESGKIWFPPKNSIVEIYIMLDEDAWGNLGFYREDRASDATYNMNIIGQSNSPSSPYWLPVQGVSREAMLYSGFTPSGGDWNVKDFSIDQFEYFSLAPKGLIMCGEEGIINRGSKTAYIRYRDITRFPWLW